MEFEKIKAKEFNILRKLFCNPGYTSMIGICENDLSELTDSGSKFRLLIRIGEDMKGILDSIDNEYIGSAVADKGMILILTRSGYQLMMSDISMLQNFISHEFKHSCEIKWGMASSDCLTENIKIFILTSLPG